MTTDDWDDDDLDFLDWCAVAAMQGMLSMASDPDLPVPFMNERTERDCDQAYTIAKAMLAVRKRVREEL